MPSPRCPHRTSLCKRRIQYPEAFVDGATVEAGATVLPAIAAFNVPSVDAVAKWFKAQVARCRRSMTDVMRARLVHSMKTGPQGVKTEPPAAVPMTD